jgi:hypothetical protein
MFWQDSCAQANSYYFDSHGDVALRPASTLEAYWHSRRFDLGDYRFSLDLARRVTSGRRPC